MYHKIRVASNRITAIRQYSCSCRMRRRSAIHEPAGRIDEDRHLHIRHFPGIFGGIFRSMMPFRRSSTSACASGWLETTTLAVRFDRTFHLRPSPAPCPTAPDTETALACSCPDRWAPFFTAASCTFSFQHPFLRYSHCKEADTGAYSPFSWNCQYLG